MNVDVTNPPLNRSSNATCVVNDQHSKLISTVVRQIIQPRSLPELQRAVIWAREHQIPLSIAGGRHAMGGQQFLKNALLLDLTGLDRLLELDFDAGTVRVEAGATWPRLLAQLETAQEGQECFWTFAQKQTGADNLTLGGALAANIHGRGLAMRPFVQDVICFDLINQDGQLLQCSRTENTHLFRLVIGGYGLFGIVYSVTLKLVPRQLLQRQVSLQQVDDIMFLFDDAIRRGCLYGDFQFAIDPESLDFLQKGVFSVYQTTDEEIQSHREQKTLRSADFERLLSLAHTDKSRAFGEYSAFYQSTNGQLYWSDQHQFSHYPEGYHERFDAAHAHASPASEMITELYVPRRCLPEFMKLVRASARRGDWNIVYGTIRLIERDGETFLPWARENWACVIFNLCVEHSPAGIESAKVAFQSLIDIALLLGGTYYLTYHPWARPDQVLSGYPQFKQFLIEKRALDPDELFSSNWYRSYRELC